MRKLAPLGLVLTALFAFAAQASARFGMPSPKTEAGRVMESIYAQVFIAGAIVFVIVFGMLVWVLVRYRAGSGHGRPTFERERDNLKLELTWIIVPLIIVLWVGAISYGALLDLDEPEEGDMTIHIEARQWTWTAAYDGGWDQGGFNVSHSDSPDPVPDKDTFRVPAGIPVTFNITSIDVIHALYVQDSNGAPVLMQDANPAGPHKYNHVTRTFTPGEYHIQCKEMCINPGHAYMRGKIEAVPMSEYQDWAERTQLCGQAGCETLNATIDSDGRFSVPAYVEAGNRTPIQFINNTRVVVTVDNQDDVAHTVRAGGHASVDVPAGSQSRLAFDAAPAGASFVLGSVAEGGGHPVEVVEPDGIFHAVLDEWTIMYEESDLTLEAGGTYVFEIENTGSVDHNLFFGSYGQSGPDSVVGGSATIPAGGTGRLVLQPTEDTTLDAWCNVSGHVSQGMINRGDVPVS